MRDKAKAIAVQALRKMHDIGMSPTPANYAVWYAYFEGSNSRLAEDVDRIVERTGHLDSWEAARVHDAYLAQAEPAGLAQVSGRMAAAIETLVGDIGTAEKGARAYGETLTGLTGELRENSAGLEAVVADVLAQTSRMAEANRRLEEKLNASAAEIKTLRADLEQVRQEANTDALTELANRKSFDRALRHHAVAAGEHGIPLCLLILDIDHFKVFNDAHGHQTGDEVLRLVARMLDKSVPQGCLPARLGGEEFAVLVPRLDFDQAVHLGDTVRRAVGGKKLRNLKTGTSLGTITLSVGVAAYVVGEPLDALVARADEALYLAKRGGRNRVCTERQLAGPTETPS
jgi:diguanylate cyclase